MKWDPARPPDGLEGPVRTQTPCTAQAYSTSSGEPRGGSADMGSHKHNTTLPLTTAGRVVHSTGAAKGARGEICAECGRQRTWLFGPRARNRAGCLIDALMQPGIMHRCTSECHARYACRLLLAHVYSFSLSSSRIIKHLTS